mmetsp:Transcript_55619/g.176589  ORF Transcript_55619/g.176589 Transcript_55619/m.176589 type:complete len:223 (-) Transcript_55619:233-901(-)
MERSLLPAIISRPSLEKRRVKRAKRCCSVPKSRESWSSVTFCTLSIPPPSTGAVDTMCTTGDMLAYTRNLPSGERAVSRGARLRAKTSLRRRQPSTSYRRTDAPNTAVNMSPDSENWPIYACPRPRPSSFRLRSWALGRKRVVRCTCSERQKLPTWRPLPLLDPSLLCSRASVLTRDLRGLWRTAECRERVWERHVSGSRVYLSSTQVWRGLPSCPCAAISS